MKKQKLILEQIDRKILLLKKVEGLSIPSSGWVNAIRQSLGMSLRQIGNKMNITAQSVKEIEDREIKDTISINVLKQFGNALNMKFVYGFIPRNKNLEEIIDHPNLLMWYSDEPRYDHSKINERIHFNKLSESEQNRHNYHKCLSQKTNIPTMIIYSRDGHMKDNIDFVKKHQKTNEDTNTIFFGGDTYLTDLLDDDDKTLKYYLELAEDVYTYSHFMSKKELCPAKFNM